MPGKPARERRIPATDVPRAATDSVRAGKRNVTVTNRAKVLFPESGITKGDLIEYYVAVAPKMLPFVRERPLTMERFPDGIDGERIMQKNASKYFPDWIPRATVPKKAGSVQHVVANDTATLAYLANQASITQHVWLSTIDRPDTPDQLVFDLDPSRDDFGDVRATALVIRDVLADLGLVPFVKATGSKGLHVVAPLRRARGFGGVYAFAASVAQRLVDDRPQLLTLEFFKAKREGRILLDINRNAYAQTVVAPYSVRARPGAPVAAPLDWSEVEDRRLRPDGISMREALERPDPWSAFARSARSLPEKP
jgi:bifunctional non-homologous end joining protein LigD